MSTRSFSVLIVGGGLVGASIAVALNRCCPDDTRILVIDGFDLNRASLDVQAGQGQYQPSFDTRSTALSYGSKCIYETLGLWDALAGHAEPIREIHVSEKGRFGSTCMRAEREQLPALGYVADNRWLGSVLLDAVHSAANIELRCPTRVLRTGRQTDTVWVDLESAAGEQRFETDLLIIADGARSQTCQQLGIHFTEHDYGKQAIVANVRTQLPHQGRAFERFTQSGPLAMLPLGGDAGSRGRLSSLVWVVEKDQQELMLGLEDTDFLEALQHEFGYRLGRLEAVSKRVSYPLSLVTATEQLRDRVLVMGNAAHSLHPVAGQGYNLALRGVARLAKCIGSAIAEGRSPGSRPVLNDYLQHRESDQRETIRFSHLAATAFTSRDPGIALSRELGLVALDLLPSAKSLFVRQAAGLRQSG